MSSSELEDELEGQLKYELQFWAFKAEPTIMFWKREYQFCPERKWKFDFFFPTPAALNVPLLGVEVEGGTWNGGRHNRGSGFEKDCEKYLAALDHGITVIRVTGKMVKDGRAIAAIGRFLRGSSASPATNCSHSLPKKTTKAGTRRASGASGRGKRNGFSRRPRPGPAAPGASPSRRRQGSGSKA